MLECKTNRKLSDFSIETLLRKDEPRGNVRQGYFTETCQTKTCERFNGADTEGYNQSLTSSYIPDTAKQLPPNEYKDKREDTFSWLSCTRFKPPKLPRARRKGASRRHGRGPRIPFSSQQLSVLENTFMGSQYLSGEMITRLAANLHLTETRVKIWFQNRRARYRREKECFQSTVQLSSSSHFEPFGCRLVEASSTFSCDPDADPVFSGSPNKRAGAGVGAESSPQTQSYRQLINDLHLISASNCYNIGRTSDANFGE